MNEHTKASAGGCPFSGRSATFSALYHEGLWDELAEARQEEPVFFSQSDDYWIVTRYDDVMSILHDHEHFSAENTSDSATPMHADALKIMKDGGFTAEKVQSNCDGERHQRIRDVSTKVLNLREFSALEPKIREFVTAALDKLEGKDTAELLSAVTYELPARVIFQLLGIPEEDMEQVKAWSGCRTTMNFAPSTYEQQMAGAQDMVDYWQYCVNHVKDRIENPRDDLASRLLAIRDGDDTVITMNELITVFYGVAFAGHETTTTQMTNALRALLQNRAQWEAICADPKLIPQAVEEAFRYCGAVIGWRRRVIKPVEIGGVMLQPGEPVILSFGSANRDEALFPDPHTFDVTRKNARKHVTMGNGKHVCLGAPLARLEVKILLEEITRRFPGLRLIEDAPVSHVKTFVFNASESLHVRLR